MAYTVIDVSKYNTASDYAAAANSIDGVIIRAGYRGYGSSGTLVKDPSFEKHYNGFAGKTKIGFYFFSTAINEAEAIAEADYLYSLIKGKQCDFPIYIDSEYSNSAHDGRSDSLTKSVRTAIAIAFLDRCKELGYKAGVYASDSWYNSNLNLSQLQAKGYSIWVARYSSGETPKYVSNYDMWQYTSSGTISGMSGNVDISHCYNDIAGWVNQKIDISTYAVTVSTSFFTYDGTEKTPTFTVGSLTPLRDFTWEFSNNINAGTASCKITGIGDYTGTKTFTYTINPASINDKTLELSGYGFTYTGSEIRPTPSIQGVVGSSLQVTYINNIEVGTATCTVVAEGNYTGTLSKIFTISRRSIDEYTASTSQEAYEYTGSPLTPEVTLGTLKIGTDFTCEYKDNTEIGTATITVRGVNNYTGTKTLNFRIAESVKDITNKTVILSYTTTAYNKQPQCPVVTVENLVENTDYKIDVSNNTNIGTVTLKIIGINEYTGTITKTFEITKKSLKDYQIVLPSESYPYTGEAVTPDPTVGDLIKDIDYSVSYDNNTSVGVASVTCTAKNPNFADYISITFKISNATLSASMFSLNNYTFSYDGTAKYPTVISDLIMDQDYTIRYENCINAGTARVILTGIGNYNGEAAVQYSILRQSIEDRIVNIVSTEYDYNIEPIEPEATIDGLRKNIDYTVTYYSNTNPGYGTILVSGAGNYTGDINIRFNINEKDISKCVAKYGRASTKTIYRIEDGKGLRLFTDSTEKVELRLSTDYQINSSSVKKTEEYNIVSFTVKGFGGFSGDATYIFRVLDTEPDTPVDYEDDGVYNFGDMDLEDMTAYGNYDFKSLDNEDIIIPDVPEPDTGDEGDTDTDLGDLDDKEETPTVIDDDVPDIVKDGEDYDFDAMSGMYLDKYDEDDGSNINPDGSDKGDPDEPKGDVDDGVYNFGDIDLNDETAEGDYDFGDLDEGVSEGSVAIGDYDFNKLAGDTEEWIAAGTEFVLDNTPMYATFGTTTSFDEKSGTYFVYNSTLVNGRVRMARTDEAVDMPARSCGWCKTIDLLNLGQIKVDDQVEVTGNAFIYANGSGGYVETDGRVMYVTEILDGNQYLYPYALSSSYKSARIGFASKDMLKKVEDL